MSNIRYAHIEDDKVHIGPTRLPKAWMNTSGFQHLSDEELKQYGWLPWELIEIEVGHNEVYTEPVITIHSDRVTEQQTKRAKTPEEQQQYLQGLQDDIANQTQQRLDSFARTRNYDGILSACTYATSTVPKFAAEGQYCVEARDATWAALYQILAEVEAGTRPVPSGYEDIESELPPLNWPDRPIKQNLS